VVTALLTACGGFLLAVLWMDLMFDVQVLRHRQAARIVPNAIRLGSRVDPPARQSELARTICRDHLFCFAGITAFVAVQLGAAA
jgi:hypothetical protein